MRPERAAVVGFSDEGEAALEELKRLLETAGGVAVAEVVKRRSERDAATLIGRGKAEEIAALARDLRLDLVVFDEDLTPGQQRNLADIIPAKIVDRTRLILDIFARRARTNEGKLQVELAQLNYLLPRMTERFGRFEQQTGGARGGIGTRGPGERKLETDRRRVRDRIARVRRDIERIRTHRALQKDSRARVPMPIVALVGYTNVGKSTLLNALVAGSSGKGAVYADDKLFATLDPTARRVKLPGGRPAVFVDTVGFIQKLPHHLVDAFHATLDVVQEADLLVHVADAAHPEWKSQIAVVEKVLADLDAGGIPAILLFNKADRLGPAERRRFREEGRLLASAAQGNGLGAFLRSVEEALEKGGEEREFLLPHARRDLLPLLYGAGRVLKEKSVEGGVLVRARLDPQNWGRLDKELGRFR
jgi:GTP-binding protein HflX